MTTLPFLWTVLVLVELDILTTVCQDQLYTTTVTFTVKSCTALTL